MPGQRSGEDPTDVYKELILRKYGVTVRDDELGIVHRIGYKVQNFPKTKKSKYI